MYRSNPGADVGLSAENRNSRVPKLFRFQVFFKKMRARASQSTEEGAFRIMRHNQKIHRCTNFVQICTFLYKFVYFVQICTSFTAMLVSKILLVDTFNQYYNIRLKFNNDKNLNSCI